MEQKKRIQKKYRANNEPVNKHDPQISSIELDKLNNLHRTQEELDKLNNSHRTQEELDKLNNLHRTQEELDKLNNLHRTRGEELSQLIEKTDNKTYSSRSYRRAFLNSIDVLKNNHHNSTKSPRTSFDASSNVNNVTDEINQVQATDRNKPTEMRIEFIKNILHGNILAPMIDFNTNTKVSEADTMLNKKIIDAKDLFANMNIRLKYMKSGTTGHTFKAISLTNKKVAFAVKVCAYPKDDYGGIHNMSRPENAELRMLKLLGCYVIKKHTPHFVIPIATFNTSIVPFVNIHKNFVNLEDEKNQMYKEFVERYNNNEFDEFVSILISEWADGGDLLDYFRRNYKKITLLEWKVIFFQILFTLATIQKYYPAFRHNDMKANNILVQKTKISSVSDSGQDKCYSYALHQTRFIIPNINMQIKIWDFDFACIRGIIENNKVNAKWTEKINITNKQNRYYDMHYFFNTLISERFMPRFYDGHIPPEVIEFIHRIIPSEVRGNGKYVHPKKGRILINTEVTCPEKVIMEDPLFEEFRYKYKSRKPDLQQEEYKGRKTRSVK